MFEQMLPQDELNRLCQQCGVIERQRKLNLAMLVRAMVIAAGRRAAPMGSTSCALTWSLRCHALRERHSIGGSTRPSSGSWRHWRSGRWRIRGRSRSICRARRAG